jgi:hypothetical protein
VWPQLAEEVRELPEGRTAAHRSWRWVTVRSDDFILSFLMGGRDWPGPQDMQWQKQTMEQVWNLGSTFGSYAVLSLKAWLNTLRGSSMFLAN